jgi:hypothetical protein
VKLPEIGVIVGSAVVVLDEDNVVDAIGSKSASVGTAYRECHIPSSNHLVAAAAVAVGVVKVIEVDDGVEVTIIEDGVVVTVVTDGKISSRPPNVTVTVWAAAWTVVVANTVSVSFSVMVCVAVAPGGPFPLLPSTLTTE